MSKDWSIVLNDTENNCLIVLFVPAGSVAIRDESESGLKVRPDRPDRIELKISVDTLIDTVSSVDFSAFVSRRIPY